MLFFLLITLFAVAVVVGGAVVTLMILSYIGIMILGVLEEVLPNFTVKNNTDTHHGQEFWREMREKDNHFGETMDEERKQEFRDEYQRLVEARQ